MAANRLVSFYHFVLFCGYPMFIPVEVLKYAASLVITALGFIIVRLIRDRDRHEARITQCEKDIIQIKTRMEIPIAATAGADS